MKRLIILFFLFPLFGFAQSTVDSDKRVVYKTIGDLELTLDFIFPENYSDGKDFTAMIFYFGGGWSGGSTAHFEPQARYFASRGLVCVLADYRINQKHKTTPFESVKDAKSAMRFLRKNAKEYKIDPNKIIGAGGSAGGHLAATCAFIKEFNEDSDDLTISPKPNALVLFNPVIDNGPGGYGYGRVGDKYPEFSPLHNIKEGAPPTLFLLGTMDNLIPVETAEYYKVVMEKVGSRCDLILYKKQGHGFFNKKNSEKMYKKTVQAADEFLASLGYLEGKPTVN